MEKSKIAPKYNLWQNSIYVIRYTWEQDKLVIYIILTQILLTILTTLFHLKNISTSLKSDYFGIELQNNRIF